MDNSITIQEGQTWKDVAILNSKGVLKNPWGQTLAYFNKEKRQIVDPYGKIFGEILEDGTVRTYPYEKVLCRIQGMPEGPCCMMITANILQLLIPRQRKLSTPGGKRIAVLKGYKQGGVRVVAAFYITVLKGMLEK